VVWKGEDKSDEKRKEENERKRQEEEKMDNVDYGVDWTSFLLLLLVVMVFGGGYLLQRSKKGQRGREESEKNLSLDEEKEIEKWFQNALEKWRKECLGYRINKKIRELSILSEDFDRFLEKRGLKRVYFTPVIDIPLDLASRKKERVMRYLKEVGYQVKDPDNLEEAMREYLLKEVEKEAEAIVKEYLERSRD